MDKRPLEFKEYKNYSRELLEIRKRIIKKYLNFNNLDCNFSYNPCKNQYTYTYYNRQGVIYLKKEDLNEILISINQLDNKDIIFSDNQFLEKYNHHINRRKRYQVKEIMGVKTVKKDHNLVIRKEIKNKHYSENPERIKNFLSIFPEINNFFHYDNVYEKENLSNIDKYKLPLYKLMKENKYALLKLLKNHNFNYTPEDINHFLLHDRLPFCNYQELRKNLESYHNMPKEKYHKIFKKHQEEACLYLLGRDEVIILEEPSGFNVYTKKEYDQDEEEIMKDRYIEKFKKTVNDPFDVTLDYLNNKEIINIEIIDGKAYNNQNKQYHRGFFSNGLYQCEEELEKKENLDINTSFLDIEIFPEMGNFHTIIISSGSKFIEVPYFYIPNDKEFILDSFIEKLWQKGKFLTHFGKAVYLNENKILESELILPDFFQSSNKKEFEDLILNN